MVDLLARGDLLSREQAARVRLEAERTSHPHCEILSGLGFVAEAKLVDFLAERLEVPVVGPESLRVEDSVLRLIPEPLQRRIDFMPLKQVGRALSVAMADPTDHDLITTLAKATGLQVRPVLAPLSALRELHARRGAIDSLRQDSAKGGDWQRYAAFFEKLQDFRFESVLGQGGFGLVCLCRQLSLDRRVAIKVLNPDWNPVAQVAERFQREGQIIAKLDHPNVIRVYEQGQRDGFRYIAMEFFAGRRIDHYLKDKDWGRVLSALLQVCAAIGCAHERGVIHRDIKPGNILANEMGAIKLLDFGVAHFDAAPAGLTSPQLILGTPKYMAPELNLGADKASRASDLYAFGVMAYEILTGRPAPTGEQEVLPSQLDRRIPRSLGTLLARCLDSRPDRRPRSFAELACSFQEAIDEIVFGELTQARNGATAISTRSRMQALERLYEFKSILRQGRRSKTVHAWNRDLGRDVVIKFMESPKGEEKLQALAALREPHIGEVYGVGKQGRMVLMVREYFAGGSLARRLSEPAPPATAAAWIEGVVRALRQAEREGMRHGNLHPGNLFLGEGGGLKLVDFGLHVEETKDYPQYRLLRVGAPEADQDRHGLGVLIYELASGASYPGGTKFGPIYEAFAANPKIHPLLKYFLGRLWGVREGAPAYEDYADMLADLERIHNRMATQGDWMADGAANDPLRPQQDQSTETVKPKRSTLTLATRAWWRPKAANS